MKDDSEVTVLGGGPAGTATALQLAALGHSVILLEPGNYKARKIGETLPPAANSVLKHLGIWDAFRQQDHREAHGVIAAWGQEQAHVNDFFCRAEGAGWHLDRRKFDLLLAREAEKRGVYLIQDVRQLTVQASSGNKGWKVQYKSKQRVEQVRCRFVVDATGRSRPATLRVLSGHMPLDRLIGVTQLYAVQTFPSYTVIESAENGWFYCASIPGGFATVVYMTDGDLFAEGVRNDPNFLKRQLLRTKFVSALLCGAREVGCRTVKSAATEIRKRVYGNNWLAVGDAAAAFDPLSSLGILKALDSAAHAAEAIHGFFRGTSLEPYQVWHERITAKYFDNLKFYYRQEQRWPSALFWMRRR